MRLLADLTRVGYLPRVRLAPPGVRDLRRPVGHRVRLLERRRATKLQVTALLREARLTIQGPRGSKRWLLGLRDNARLSEQARWVMNDLLGELEHVCGKVAQVERRLREATAGNAVVSRLREIEGVGEVTAWMLAARVGRFDRFKAGEQLSRYCGLSPRNASGGKRQADAGLIDAADKPLRAVLMQAGRRLVRGEGRWKDLADSLLRRGKPKPVVVAAVANRWVRSMHHRMLGGGGDQSKMTTTK